jgi:hypothetical protein
VLREQGEDLAGDEGLETGDCAARSAWSTADWAAAAHLRNSHWRCASALGGAEAVGMGRCEDGERGEVGGARRLFLLRRRHCAERTEIATLRPTRRTAIPVLSDCRSIAVRWELQASSCRRLGLDFGV